MRVLISDIGGVLVENHQDRIAQTLAMEYGLSESRLREEISQNLHALDVGELSVAGLHARMLSLREPPVPLARFRQIVLDDSLTELAPTREAYERLKASEGARLVALSNMGEEVFAALAAKFHVDSLFDAVVLSCRTGVAKPDPRAFTIALAAAGAPASECLFLDDSPGNVEVARRLGIRAELVGAGEAVERILNRYRREQ